MREEMQARFERDWAESMAMAVGAHPPAHAEWRGVDEIGRVLAAFAGQNKNHAHLPTGGGMDVLEVRPSTTEPGCLELWVTERTVYLVKPELLEFEFIESSPHDSFLLLHLSELKPSGVYENAENYEELLDLGDGEYVERSVWDQGYHGHDERGYELPLPKSARLVIRWFGGKILFVAKGTLWNGSTRTYDGVHNRLTAAEIKAGIERVLQREQV